ncbi:TIM barrel protein [Luteolibacter sp. GHJ8]|uniref:TIM barrel protein n=1 Tax=Luteolibacter rhizosphaerae TaxID=2989719 RepID=A0ABT3G0Q9_9BACT|nr:TIM barrel protein [Luteolibacter rhizosphaerae]MCW1913413.1 TIM barrel protein [Luteolibacter rhizosphaerae]
MSPVSDTVFRALESFRIETPSWGYADTGTRFGKFHQPAAAIDLNDKLADAAHVHRLTACCPTVATHVLWDFAPGTEASVVAAKAAELGIKIGSINPNLFQDQLYKLGSVGSPFETARDQALAHILDCIEIGKATESRAVSLWFADGTNYPGQDSIRARKQRFEAALKEAHARLSPEQILLVEYKPFEPAFYQTDLADWGMSFLTAKKAGPQAKVLVDTGHHYLSQNIEQIVAWLLDEEMLGGFHFNDRKYADDDLTLGSIDPYQIFRIFHEIHSYAADHGGKYPEIEYMIDQSHNLKPKIEAMIQTVCTAQELYAKAALVDHAALQQAQRKGNIVDAESCLKKAFNTDVTEAIAEWRKSKGLDADPLAAHRASGYAEKAAAERSKRRQELGIATEHSYA